MPSIAIIIPCYNEADRLSTTAFTSFLKDYPSWTLVFINDGSTDGTAHLLEQIKSAAQTRAITIHLDTNRGKGQAIWEGMRFCLDIDREQFDFIGYLDADLSTSLSEMARIAEIAGTHQLDYACGSRIRKLNTSINRSFFRHIAGRTIASIIDSRFHLGIYDTQCGAKLFRIPLVKKITEKEFYTKWLFDVEIFLRIDKELPDSKGEEIPLLVWNTRKGSKLNISHGFFIFREITLLLKKYPGKYTRE